MPHSTLALLFRARIARPSALTLAAALVACNLGLTSSDEDSWSADDEITAQEIKRDLTWLADDARQGRGLLTPGLDAAADFIAKRFETLGLVKLEKLEGYFQPFEMPFGAELVPEKTQLSAEALRELELGKDFTPLAWSKPGQFEGELVFAGYGMTSERNNYDDYAGADVEGKVVLAMRYEPHGADGKSAFTKTDRNSREGAVWAKARAAERAGAVAMILVDPPMHHGDEDRLMEFGRGSQRAGIPVFHVKRSVAQRLLREAGLHNLRKLQQEIDSSGEPATQAGSKPIKLMGGFEAEEKRYPIKNVVGMVPGKRSDEFIVIGAHYDHVGMGEYGSSYGREIHNGADDNGSGTTTMLALAEAFAKAPEKPQRSIIFIAFTAEELGLIGSKHFVDNSPVPVDQIAAMVNLDMVGRAREEKVMVGGWNSSPVFPELLKKADEASPLALSDMGGDFASRSDHFNFAQKKIPNIFFFTGLHEEYHSPRDDVPLINFEGMEEVAEMVYGLVRDIDALPREQLSFNDPEPREMMGQATRPGTRPATRPSVEPNEAAQQRRARLGIMPDFMPDAGGVKVGSVGENSPAAKAGIQADDIILRIGDADIRTLEDLQQVLVSAEPGTKAMVTLLRGGERKEIEVTFE